MNTITKVSFQEASSIIESRKPLGMFYLKNEIGGYTGIDNRDGDAWTEDFKSLSTCRNWLKT